jgi:hypothetical protein
MGLLATLGLSPTAARRAAGTAASAAGAPPQATPPGAAAAATDKDQLAYEKAAAAIKPQTDAGQAALAADPGAVGAAAAKTLADTRQAVEQRVAAGDWVGAKAALPAWRNAAMAVSKAVTQHASFAAGAAKHEATLQRARDAVATAAPLPTALSTAFTTADAARAKAVAALAWADATAKLVAAVVAAKALLAPVDKGAAFYAAWMAAKPDRDAAFALARSIKDKLPTMGRIALLVTELVRADKAVDKAAKAQQWKPATALVAPLQKAAQELLRRKADRDTAAAPFESAFKAMQADIAAADAIADAAPAALKDQQAKAFRERLTAVVDARDRDDFAAATAGLAALRAAIDALTQANAAVAARRQAFEVAMARITQHGAAVVLAAPPPAAVQAQAAAFTAADQVVMQARLAGDWDAAANAVPALGKAVDALLAARDQGNTSAGPQDLAAFRVKLAALGPRIATASDAPDSAFVDGLQRAVRERVAAIESLLGAGKLVDAESGFARLPAELDAMDQARQLLQAHRARFAAARDGEVNKAMQTKLEPGGLAAARTKALEDLRQAIEDFADQGMVAQADKQLPEWVAQAKAWVASKAAYDNLNGQKPSAKTLGSLVARPGGAQVLDAMVAALPPDPPQQAMEAALTARYGFGVKRFSKQNKEPDDLKGLKEQGPKTPDKPLKMVYEMLGKIPARNVKGKVKELVQYDSDSGGAMFSPDGRKIYMYCGRPDDPKAKEERFDEAGKVVPAGEEVQEECKPATTAPVRFFDFALLHEVGHGEDEAKNYMQKRLKNKAFGDWQEHGVGAVAKVAAAHFGYDLKVISATLATKGSKPPAKLPAHPKGSDEAAWKQAQEAALEWCRSVREDNQLWNNAALSKQVAIGGRVYQECYADTWVSYDYAARQQGITGYQFRSHWEWFAELYAAYFSKRLQAKHPAASWLAEFDPPAK